MWHRIRHGHRPRWLLPRFSWSAKAIFCARCRPDLIATSVASYSQFALLSERDSAKRPPGYFSNGEKG